MGFKKNTTVVTGSGTTGSVVSEIKHPVTRNTTGVVVQPTGTAQPESQIVANPSTTRPVDGS